MISQSIRRRLQAGQERKKLELSAYNETVTAYGSSTYVYVYYGGELLKDNVEPPQVTYSGDAISDAYYSYYSGEVSIEYGSNTDMEYGRSGLVTVSYKGQTVYYNLTQSKDGYDGDIWNCRITNTNYNNLLTQLSINWVYSGTYYYETDFNKNVFGHKYLSSVKIASATVSNLVFEAEYMRNSGIIDTKDYYMSSASNDTSFNRNSLLGFSDLELGWYIVNGVVNGMKLNHRGGSSSMSSGGYSGNGSVTDEITGKDHYIGIRINMATDLPVGEYYSKDNPAFEYEFYIYVSSVSVGIKTGYDNDFIANSTPITITNLSYLNIPRLKVNTYSDRVVIAVV